MAARWSGWRLGNMRPTFEPIIWCFKPYKVTIADNVLEHELGAYNQEAFASYFGEPNNCMTCGLDPDEGGLHPAQKPVKLLKALIELTTRPGHLVLDPFAGSGSTAVAAHQLARRWLVIEQDPRLCAVIERRLHAERAVRA
jgi:site-specific DNA-methyltransferase (adenine-specific)